jgi:hypothetical protein
MRNDHLDVAVSFQAFSPPFSSLISSTNIINQFQGGDREKGNSSAEGCIGRDTEVR